MSKNFHQRGDVLDLTAPAGGVVAGVPVQIGSLFGVPAVSAAEGETFACRIEGVFRDVPKTAGVAWAEGTPLYFDPATGKLTTVAGSLKKVAIAVSVALSADLVGVVKLVPTV